MESQIGINYFINRHFTVKRNASFLGRMRLLRRNYCQVKDNDKIENDIYRTYKYIQCEKCMITIRVIVLVNNSILLPLKFYFYNYLSNREQILIKFMKC